MKVTFLEAKVPLTKTFRRVDGEITKDGHPKIVDYKSHWHEVSHTDIGEFYAVLVEHASKLHCWQKGNTKNELDWGSRRDQSDPNELTKVMVLDFDGSKTFATPAAAVAALGLGNPDNIVQYSSSMGVLPDKGLSAHVFILLDRWYTAAELKEWLKHKNFSVPELASGIRLSSNSNALRWTLDITTCQNDKLIYIAPPVCEDGVVDGFKGERIALVRGDVRTASLDMTGVSAQANVLRIAQKHDSLRAEAGLEKKKWDRARTEKGTEYMPDPDVCTVTGSVRVGEKFTDFNLNNGDSFAYYHLTENAYFMYNFKGEPTYRLKDIVPEYWRTLRANHMRMLDVRRDGIEVLGFVDFRSSKYYRGTWNPATQVLDLSVATGKEQVVDYLKEMGAPVPETLPTFALEFNPQSKERVALDRKWINLFQASPYLLRELEPAPEMPACWDSVFKHVVNGDDETYQHLVHWIAALLQFRRRLDTSWLWQGTYGTGKGLIYHELLEPCLGPSNVTIKRIDELTGQFTGFLDNKLLVFVDDNSGLDSGPRMRMVESNLRTWTTSPTMSIRHMYAAHRDVPNFCNFLLTTNDESIAIQVTDRRVNVGPYQATPMAKPRAAGMKVLRAALWQAYCHLMQMKVDEDRVMDALLNDAKRLLAKQSSDSFSNTCHALLRGNHEYFVSMKDVKVVGLMGHERDNAVEYSELVDKMKGYKCLFRGELHLLFNHITGKVDIARGRFTNRLLKHRLPMGTVRRGGANGDVGDGIYVNWREQE